MKKLRLPWKTKRILRTMADWNTPARMRRYRRMNRPSLSRQLGLGPHWAAISGMTFPWCRRVWNDNRARLDRKLRAMGMFKEKA
jgi:endonuclease/exonuclease/phosphatase family metal-dependent hydrolase